MNETQVFQPKYVLFFNEVVFKIHTVRPMPLQFLDNFQILGLVEDPKIGVGSRNDIMEEKISFYQDISRSLRNL